MNTVLYSLHERIRHLAKQEGVSINQFIASAAAEKMASLMTENYIKIGQPKLI